ncbi:MAG: helix-turn-helix domain-containing protein [Desulfobulbus sp.]|nr:helix-turn-helix domain-containing protein [Desulfobulbus sp.]
MSDQVDAGLPVGEEAAVPLPPPSVGEQLAAGRLAQGLTVADVAQTLKLGARQVEALESGNWRALPGNTFIRGFVRNYARLLGLDAASLMAALDTVLEKPASVLTPPPSHRGAMPRMGGKESRRDRLVVMAGGALVALAALLYFLAPSDLSGLRDSAQRLLNSLARHETPAAPPAEPAEPAFPPGATPQQIINPQATATEEAAAEPPATAMATANAPITAAPASPKASPAAAGEGQLRLVVDKESWIEVRDRDNRLLLSQRLPAGGEQTLAGAPPLSLAVGYAPGVRLTWKGKAVDLTPYTKGDVARLVLE